MKFAQFLEKKRLSEAQTVNEVGYQEQATDVGFGLFTWGGGDELDTLSAAAAAAALIAAKGIYNGIVYAKLKAQLPGYLKMYKELAAKKAQDVWDHKYDEKYIEPLKKKLDLLVGSKKEEADRETKTETPKETITRKFKKAIDAAEGNEKKDRLRDARDQALMKISTGEKNLENEIEKLEANRQVLWEKKQEEWRQYSEKWDEKEDDFVEVGNSVLASSWKKKWDNEFTIAKNEADIEVLDEALRLAAEKKDQEEMDFIQNAKKRAEERKRKAEETISEFDEKAEVQQASAQELGIVEFMQVNTAVGQALFNANKKWSSKADSYEGGKTTKNKEDLEKKIEGAKEKIDQAKSKADSLREEGEDERADALETRIKRAEQMVAGWEEELANINDSFDQTTYFSMINRIDEEVRSLIALYEQEQKPERPTLSSLRKNVQRAISAAPDAEKNDLRSEAIEELTAIRDLKTKEAEARNNMVKRIKENREKKEDDKTEFPKGFEIFSDYKEVDPKKKTELYDEAINDLEEQGGKKTSDVEPKPDSSEKPSSDSTEEKPETDEPAEVKVQKEKIEKIRDEIKELEDKPISAKFDSGLKKIVIDQKEKELEKELKKLEDIESRGSEKKDESVHLSLSTNYVGFNDFVQMKMAKRNP